MIQVFCVLLAGEPIRLGEDAQEFGFYRNEYVVALSEAQAIAVAKARAIKRLARKAAKFIDGRPLELRVEKVKTGMSPWRLLRSEGFIYFPLEADSPDRSQS